MRGGFIIVLTLLGCLAACGSGSGVPKEASTGTPPSGDAAAPDSTSPPTEPTDAAAPADAQDAGIAAPSDDADAPVNLGPGGDFRGYADRAAAALQGFYDGSTGVWNTTGWWNSANALTALIDYSLATGSTAYTADIGTTFNDNKAQSFLNGYYDDEGWWALAWIRAYDLTQTAPYLAMAKTIFADMAGGWDVTCGGGIWWDKTHTYKNAIANELFLEVATRLHLRTPTDAGTGSFIDWANREWTWFSQSGMINASNLVNDGLANCQNNGKTTWTYNQGVLIGGLVDLEASTGDASLLTKAGDVASAAMTKLVDARGVLREPCEPSCGGDGPQFKGIFMRHLGELETATHDPLEQAFIARNADWIWNASRNGSDQLGLIWAGPFDSADAARQSSALDALVAAIPFTQPESNLALSKPATANGSCAPGQTAAQAFDGTVTTKWCAGSNNGDYWLDVDLGAPTSVGRIIVRHAGAGGENPAWNTKDFTLSLLSMDGGAPTVIATVTGNTLPVTIHDFDAAKAQHVRLDIAGPQTATTTVAARIDELEVYAR